METINGSRLKRSCNPNVETTVPGRNQKLTTEGTGENLFFSIYEVRFHIKIVNSKLLNRKLKTPASSVVNKSYVFRVPHITCFGKCQMHLKGVTERHRGMTMPFRKFQVIPKQFFIVGMRAILDDETCPLKR